MTKRPNTGHFESEVAFIITNNAEETVEDLAGLTSILEYDLKPKPTLQIHDTYYDTKQGLLQKKRISLRVRKVNGKSLVSMKSNPQRLSGEGVRRIEIEAPLSSESLTKIQTTLKIDRVRSQAKFSGLSHSNMFGSMGLRIVQKRITTRIARQILRHDMRVARPIAELDIDKVTFFGNPRVHLFEVEVEAKAPRSEGSIQKIAESLASNYPGSLTLWPYGKLTTGITIQRLLESGVLQSYLEHGRLKPEAFPLIKNNIHPNS